MNKNPFERYDMLTIGIKTKGTIIRSYPMGMETWFDYQFIVKEGKLQLSDIKTFEVDELLLDTTKKPIQANITYLASSPEVSWIDRKGMEDSANHWEDYCLLLFITTLVIFVIPQLIVKLQKEANTAHSVNLNIKLKKQLR